MTTGMMQQREKKRKTSEFISVMCFVVQKIENCFNAGIASTWFLRLGLKKQSVIKETINSANYDEKIAK